MSLFQLLGRCDVSARHACAGRTSARVPVFPGKCFRFSTSLFSPVSNLPTQGHNHWSSALSPDTPTPMHSQDTHVCSHAHDHNTPADVNLQSQSHHTHKWACTPTHSHTFTTCPSPLTLTHTYTHAHTCPALLTRGLGTQHSLWTCCVPCHGTEGC